MGGTAQIPAFLGEELAKRLSDAQRAWWERHRDEVVLRLRPLGGPALVSRHIEDGELVWEYPGIGTPRMERICRLPPELT